MERRRLATYATGLQMEKVKSMFLLSIILAVLFGYLVGSIPAAYLMGKLKGYDMMQNGDASLGTSLAFRKLGVLPGLAVGLIDFAKGTISIVVALLFEVPFPVVLLAGLVAITGHNWSIFLGFKGGRGSMTSYGVLAALMLWEFLIALGVGGVVFYFTRKTTLSTIVLLGALPVILWWQSRYHVLPAPPWEREIDILLILFPLSILIPIFLKFVQVPRDKKLL